MMGNSRAIELLESLGDEQFFEEEGYEYVDAEEEEEDEEGEYDESLDEEEMDAENMTMEPGETATIDLEVKVAMRKEGDMEDDMMDDDLEDELLGDEEVPGGMDDMGIGMPGEGGGRPPGM
jgi:hypothetical protein